VILHSSIDCKLSAKAWHPKWGASGPRGRRET